jgi:hypothetical protein
MARRVLRSVTAAASAVALSAALASTASAADRHAAPSAFTATVLLNGAQLHHEVNGKPEALSGPDDIARLPGRIFVAFQNGVGSMGEPSGTGNTSSTLVEANPSGHVVRQWDLTGKIDGLGANRATGQVVATVNEDGNSSIYAINTRGPAPKAMTHYTYNQSPLPHGGGTDGVTFTNGLLLVAASAPTVATGPAVYEVTLHNSGNAEVKSLFADNAPSTPANPGAPSTLSLTDPDSTTVVPVSAPRFAGDYMLDSQGDEQQIYVSQPGTPAQALSVLALSQSVDDTAFVTKHKGELVTTDSTADTVDVVKGPFQVGQAFTAVTPCNANNAPSTCPAPGFSANYLGTINLTTGTVLPISVGGVTLTPKGMLYLP